MSLDVWVEEGLSSAEVTLQESTAANLEYADWYCASELAAAAFCEFGGGSDSLLPSLLGMGNRFTGPLLTCPPSHTRQWPPYVHALMHKCYLLHALTTDEAEFHTILDKHGEMHV